MFSIIEKTPDPESLSLGIAPIEALTCSSIQVKRQTLRLVLLRRSVWAQQDLLCGFWTGNKASLIDALYDVLAKRPKLNK